MTLKSIRGIKIEHLAPNQIIIHDGPQSTFISYDSVIAVVERGKPTYLGRNWNYSRTTSKYRNQFLLEVTLETQSKLDSGEYRLLKDS